MLRFIFLSSLIFFSNAISAQTEKEIALFQEANSAFEKANLQALKDPTRARKLYRESALQYDALISQYGIQNSALYTNLGNAHFFLGNFGKALVNYHRAIGIDPSNRDALHNINYLQSQNTDKLPENSLIKEILSTLIFWHNWPLNLRILLFAISFSALLYLLARRLFTRKAKDSYTIITSLSLSLLIGISAAISAFHLDRKVDGVITAKEANARQGNGYIYEAAFNSNLHNGTEFKLLETRHNWLHIELLDGSPCWIEKKFADLID